MLDFAKFYVSIILKRVLDDHHDGQDGARPEAAACKNPTAGASQPKLGDDLLDLSYPLMSLGYDRWIKIHQFTGLVNWENRPLYVSIIYRLLILVLTGLMNLEVMVQIIEASGYFEGTLNNPILVCFGVMSLFLISVNLMFSFNQITMNLGPIMAILKTPKLCQASERCMRMIGTIYIKLIILLVIINTSLFEAIKHRKDFTSFSGLDLLLILPKLFSHTYMLHCMFGTSHFDYYIRTSFGCWIWGLKFNLEQRFERFSRYKRNQLDCWAKQFQANRRTLLSPEAGLGPSWGPPADSSRPPIKRPQAVEHFQLLDPTEYQFVPLTEIQRNLNNMDDHLEVSRMFQTNSLVLITLNAFVSGGCLFLLCYHLVINRDEPILAALFALISIMYSCATVGCYIGDQWLYYSLSTLVQFIEDEYFVVSGEQRETSIRRQIRAEVMDRFGELLVGKHALALAANQSHTPRASTSISHGTSQQVSSQPREQQLGSVPAHSGVTGDPIICETDVRPLIEHLESVYESLLVSRADVLFYREFLHQFENHLATPWTQLTLESHLKIVSAFFTLIAAQIIFDQNNH